MYVWCVCVCMYIYFRCVFVYVCMCVRVCMCICIHIYICMYIYIYVYVCICICGGKTGKAHNKLILFQKPRVGHLLIYRNHKECPVVQITKYRSSPFVHTIQTDHVRSCTTLYICRLPANRMHTIGAALYGSARHKCHGQ